jgi:hypothetical protein
MSINHSTLKKRKTKQKFIFKKRKSSSKTDSTKKTPKESKEAHKQLEKPKFF